MSILFHHKLRTVLISMKSSEIGQFPRRIGHFEKMRNSSDTSSYFFREIYVSVSGNLFINLLNEFNPQRTIFRKFRAIFRRNRIIFFEKFRQIREKNRTNFLGKFGSFSVRSVGRVSIDVFPCLQRWCFVQIDNFVKY